MRRGEQVPSLLGVAWGTAFGENNNETVVFDDDVADLS